MITALEIGAGAFVLGNPATLLVFVAALQLGRLATLTTSSARWNPGRAAHQTVRPRERSAAHG